METSSGRGRPLYWLLVAVLLPAFNWWIGLWTVVLARDAAPLLVVMPLLLAAETAGGTWLLRDDAARTRPLGTVALLLLTTLAWSLLLTLVALALQRGAFTF